MLLDRDSDNVVFHYGSLPNVNLTLFGHVTSVPDTNENAKTLFSREGKSADLEQFKQYFQGMDQMLDLMKPIEKLYTFSSYPSVTVYPIAVYRSIPKNE